MPVWSSLRRDSDSQVNMRILLVEDDEHIVDFLKRGLKEEGYVVDIAYNGEDGLYLAENEGFDLIILDILLPKLDGFELCKRLRAKGNLTPILMLTAKDEIEDRVHGLDIGADDYLVKPFAFEELLARIRALLRRQKSIESSVLKIGDLTLNLLTREVKRGGKSIELTTREFELLKFLMYHPGQVLTRTQIAEHVWSYDFDYFSNIVDVYIRYLREKIDDPFEHKLIHTVRGAGYKIQE
jgi:heavy metal response regulator